MVTGDSEKYTILLVDDYPPVRRLVKNIIEANPELQVVGECSDGLALLDFLEQSAAQLVVLDIAMPLLNGLEATRRLKADHPEVKVLILTIRDSREYVDRALSAGAEGFLVKDEVFDELLPAISSLRQGGTYVSPRLSA
jgi:two-component system nitrate/nitrite response regulator NarL